jgi:hypothetical protein
MADPQANEEQVLAAINGKDMAFPVENVEHTPNNTVQLGLTKRELFAAMAMQGSFAHYGHSNMEHDRRHVAELCVKQADALLAALKEVQP